MARGYLKPMKRRTFLTVGVCAVAGLALAGGAWRVLGARDPLAPFRRATKKVLSAAAGSPRAEVLQEEIETAYARMAPSLPDLGGREGMFSEWLTYGAWCLCVYEALKQAGWSCPRTGEILYRTFEVMADYPGWFLNLLGRLKYGDRYVARLEEAAGETLTRYRPEGWVCTFIEGDGRAFDYGLDITECGICKLYARHQAMEIAPYVCLSDFVVSRAFDRGLVRFHTLAEGALLCDFRYQRGRETFVSPLGSGWPPRFAAR